MKKRNPSLYKIVFVGVAVIAVAICCTKKTGSQEESVLSGEATFYVDESIFPIVEDVRDVFLSDYRAKINLIAKPESEVVNALLSDKTKVVILPRKLTVKENEILASRHINPKITEFGTDAVAFITHKNSKDTLADLQEAINVMQGKPSLMKKLVFENPNSGTVSIMNNLAGTNTNSLHDNVYSMKSAEEVLKYISGNPDAVGVVGINIILQPDAKCQELVNNIKVMAVRNVKNQKNDNAYYKPNQSNIALGLYPITRKLYMLNFQGTAGLGMGFASFIAGERGQRIILKSGLLPVRIPSRNITIRKDINTK
ncbi:PstS family phosphate ABC transporter substrate-binding protein [Flavobacterium sp.]|uniref:PstS family phosphate ABC transporter substrate-binding protein n=1 Tax=Flavobacterium sp. TaxID=239 RepID=UPI00260D55EA|nr:substrate-binding domain-containing protein [Flavobacterium sp.]